MPNLLNVMTIQCILYEYNCSTARCFTPRASRTIYSDEPSRTNDWMRRTGCVSKRRRGRLDFVKNARRRPRTTSFFRWFRNHARLESVFPSLRNPRRELFNPQLQDKKGCLLLVCYVVLLPTPVEFSPIDLCSVPPFEGVVPPPQTATFPRSPTFQNMI